MNATIERTQQLIEKLTLLRERDRFHAPIYGEIIGRYFKALETLADEASDWETRHSASLTYAMLADEWIAAKLRMSIS